MPERILQLLEKGSLTEWQLAQALQISLDELRACVEYLERAGFIRSCILNPMQTGSCVGCSGSCKKCNGACPTSGSSLRVWEIQ